MKIILALLFCVLSYNSGQNSVRGAQQHPPQRIPSSVPRIPSPTPRAPRSTPQPPKVTPQPPKVTPQPPKVTPQPPKSVPHTPRERPRDERNHERRHEHARSNARHHWNGSHFEPRWFHNHFGYRHAFFLCDDIWYGEPYLVGSEFVIEDIAWGVIYPIPGAWRDCGQMCYIEEFDGIYYLCNPTYPERFVVKIIF